MTTGDAITNAINAMKLELETQKQIQLAKLEANTALNPESKAMISTMIELFSPMISVMGATITTSIATSMEVAKKGFVSHEALNDQSARARNALVEQFYNTDKLECKLRYKNLRIAGLCQTVDNASFVRDYADNVDIEIAQSDIESTRTLRDDNNGKGKIILVSFASDGARNRFTKAKHLHIQKRKQLKEELRDTPNKQSRDAKNRREEISALKKIKISEDRTPTRYKLLRFVCDLEGINDAYTRNGVIHVIHENLQRAGPTPCRCERTAT